jgi:phosphoglycerol transferase MdoB-like AlkP superfamily enzyme
MAKLPGSAMVWTGSRLPVGRCFPPPISLLNSPLSAWLRRLLVQRQGGTLLFLLAFLALALLTRLLLLVKSAGAVGWDASLLGAFLLGLSYDLGAGLLAAVPLVLLLIVLPAGFFARGWARGLAGLGFVGVLGLLTFGVVSEWVFWDEFSVRFNFIAVDYLVYTKEVIGNIRESYPMPLIFGGVALVAALKAWLGWRAGLLQAWFSAEPERLGRRALAGGGWLAAAAVAGLALDSDRMPAFANNYNRELAKNGTWSLFAAFRNNELDYDEFYPTLPVDEAFRLLKTDLARDGAVPLMGEGRDTLRYIRSEGTEQRPNVIQITVESLSAEFLGTFNPKSTLTPNLDELAGRSLVFERLYATGTRTDRGMEALSLSLPPTPGRSLVKRPRNENLFTLGSVFRSRGYDTAFVYGGFGYFDNMNYFFGSNGYRVIDRAVASNDITFANVWGACDEDLFRWASREADAAHAAGRPFHHFVMTTSNHRPFTYPEGRIDLPSKVSGRDGAVKYTDYAIGKFLRDAASKPWYRNTVFVIVADHCASSAGKTALPVQNYHIPLIIFSPGGHIPPGRVKALMSQVDYAPTLLGLLNWSYASRFFGWDIRRVADQQRALLGNYQRLGLYQAGGLNVMMPVRRFAEYDVDEATWTLSDRVPRSTQRSIAYYQTASHLYRTNAYRELSREEQERAAKAAVGPVQPPGRE